MGILGKIFGKKFSKGDRVRFALDWPVTYDPKYTGYSEKILVDFGKEGTIIDSSRNMATVRWDPGSYRIYRDIVLDVARKLIVVDKGSVTINGFIALIHTSNIEKIS